MVRFGYVTLGVDEAQLPRLRGWYRDVAGLSIAWQSLIFCMLTAEGSGRLEISDGRARGSRRPRR